MDVDMDAYREPAQMLFLVLSQVIFLLLVTNINDVYLQT